MTELAFVGAGALGQAFAALLAASGQPATLLATPGTAARLGEAGAIRLRGVVTLEIPVAGPPAAPGQVGNFPIRTYVSHPDEETVARLAGRGLLSPAASKGVAMLPSMTQDFLAGRAIEVDEVFGDLVDRAERAGVAVPRLRLVRDLLRGQDPGRHPG